MSADLGAIRARAAMAGLARSLGDPDPEPQVESALDVPALLAEVVTLRQLLSDPGEPCPTQQARDLLRAEP
jgi:hypothetical protein